MVSEQQHLKKSIMLSEGLQNPTVHGILSHSYLCTNKASGARLEAKELYPKERGPRSQISLCNLSLTLLHSLSVR